MFLEGYVDLFNTEDDAVAAVRESMQVEDIAHIAKALFGILSREIHSGFKISGGRIVVPIGAPLTLEEFCVFQGIVRIVYGENVLVTHRSIDGGREADGQEIEVEAP